MTDTTIPASTEQAEVDAVVDPVARVLERAEAHSGVRVFGAAQALQDQSTTSRSDTDGEQWDREERAALRRVPACRPSSRTSPKSSIGSCASRT